MTTELLMLLGAVALYFVLTLWPALASIGSIGLFKAAGSRDELEPRTGKAARCDRALANHAEALMMFTPVVLTAHMMGVESDMSALGAEVFLGGRVAHAIFYLLGVPFVKSLSYLAGLVGIGMIVAAIFGLA